MSTGTALPSGYVLAPLVSFTEVVTDATANTNSTQDDDTARLQTLFTLDAEVLKTQLVNWVKAGGRGQEVVWSQSFTSSSYLCKDGRYRFGTQYIFYCLSTNGAGFQATLNTLFPGLNPRYYLSNGNFYIAVSLS